MTNDVTATVDIEAIQKKANEYAMEGAVKALKEHYTGYNSPYVKAIEEHLKEKAVSVHLDLPDIIGAINTTLSNEIDSIANAAIAKSYLPLVKRFLRRAPEQVNFSDILKRIIEDCYDKDRHKYSCEMSKNEKYEWLNVSITTPEGDYDLTLHKMNKDEGFYRILSLPHHAVSSRRQQTMTVRLDDGAKLEMPFTYDVLRESVIAYVGNLILSETKIAIDTEDFEDEHFPDECYCH